MIPMKRVLINSLVVTLIVGLLVYFYLSLPDVSVLKTQKPTDDRPHGGT